MKTLDWLTAVALVGLLTQPVAADFAAGMRAFRKGDFKKAHREWLPLAENGNGIAQYNLGTLYDTGKGVEKDSKEAAKWLTLASEQGVVDAQVYLGLMYSEGQGVLKSQSEAVKWYRRAAEQESGRGQYMLALAYQTGDGVAKDTPEAHMWYSLAAANGYSKGAERRDQLARRMTAAELSEAERLLSERKPGASPQREAEPAAVSFTSDAAGAEIQLDGVFVGNTPATLRVKPGVHQVAIHRGSDVWKRDLTVLGGSSLTVHAVFKK